MKLVDNIKTSYAQIPYTWNHKKKLLELERKFTGKNSFRIVLHDVDKLAFCIFLPFMDDKMRESIHRRINKHHHYADISNLPPEVCKEIVLDWESAQYTKPDKPRTAREWCLYGEKECYKYLVKYFDEWRI